MRCILLQALVANLIKVEDPFWDQEDAYNLCEYF